MFGGSKMQRMVVQQNLDNFSRLKQKGAITPGASSYNIWEFGYEHAKFQLAGALYYEGIQEGAAGRAKVSEAITLLEGYGHYVARRIAEGDQQGGTERFNAIDLANIQEELAQWRKQLQSMPRW